MKSGELTKVRSSEKCGVHKSAEFTKVQSSQKCGVQNVRSSEKDAQFIKVQKNAQFRKVRSSQKCGVHKSAVFRICAVQKIREWHYRVRLFILCLVSARNEVIAD